MRFAQPSSAQLAFFLAGCCFLGVVNSFRPLPALAQNIAANEPLAINSSVSENVALSSPFRWVQIVPVGAAGEVFYALGTSPAAAVATSASPALPPGGICLNVGLNNYIAAIAAAGTATLRITQLDSCPVYVPAGASSGGSGAGGGAVTGAGGAALALDTSVGTANTALGPPGAAACATDTGSCSLNALDQRIAQRITTLITALGTPMQSAGGAVQANAGTNLNTSALALDTSVGTANTALGPPGATACATDTGSCSLNALDQRIAQRITTLITALGTPMQAGGALAANQSANVAQVNGITTLTGAGATGTGSQRHTVAQDATTIAGAPPGRTYNTIAASQTAQALTGGGGGAAGDYLSHCVVVPTSTTPGVVTIADNATAVVGFPGGASSISNLVPFTIPVGSVSVNGAWKITSGANLSVTCVGKFT